jgi:hypothetical protein
MVEQLKQLRVSPADSRQFAGATVPAAKPAFYRGKSRKYSSVPIPSASGGGSNRRFE